MIKEYIINRDNKIALQPACSDIFNLGGYKPHLHWVLPMKRFGMFFDNLEFFKVLPSEPSLVIKLDALNTELQYHPAQGFRIQYLEGMQTISPSPLHRERIECPATKGAEDILGEGLSRREEEVQAFHFNLGIPNTSMEGGKSGLGLVFQLTPHNEKGRVGLC